MAFEGLKEGISDAEASAKSYAHSTGEYYKLKSFKFLMKGITAFSKILMLGAIAFLALFFLSLAAAFGIGQALDNTFYGFLCLGMFYVIVGAILYFMRQHLNKPLLRKFSEFYFDDL